jgi:predicted NBD/HSP70 family sugar kinase
LGPNGVSVAEINAADNEIPFAPRNAILPLSSPWEPVMTKRIGIDFGGSWLRIGTIDDERPDAEPELLKFPSPRDWDEFVELVASHDAPDIEGLGIAISGPIFKHAVVVTAPNLPWLNGVPVRKKLEAKLGKKVVIANDMEAATEGEMAHGVLRQYQWAIFDTISTGWGGNLILDGKRVDGEPGHANLRFDVPDQCGAGHHGCFEALYSGRNMERRIRAQLTGMKPSDDVDPWEAFHQHIDTKSDWALHLLDDWCEGAGRAWANTMNRIRPIEAVVYMGTTADSMLAIPGAIDRVRATIQKIAMFPEHQSNDFPIRAAQEPNRSIYGAVIVYEKEA